MPNLQILNIIHKSQEINKKKKPIHLYKIKNGLRIEFLRFYSYLLDSYIFILLLQLYNSFFKLIV